ncbi:MAG: glycosyltransferase [Romboutsia sp.]|uniref:glycosyltransferase n=1 Tax=Romboutsia sp. TaxID=1965302 RepID=UPI003F33D263
MLKNGFSVITVTNRRYSIENIFKNYNNQIFPKKELIIIINDDNINLTNFNNYIINSNIRIFKQPTNVTLGQCLNFAIEKCNYDFIAKFDDDDYYSPYYIQECNNVFLNTNCDIVGKNKTYYYIEKNNELILKKIGNENKYTNSIMGSTICFKKKVYAKVKFRNLSSREDYYFNKECTKNNFKIFSSSSYNHIIFKHSDQNKHTFISNIDILISKCETIKVNVSLDECFSIVDIDL